MDTLITILLLAGVIGVAVITFRVLFKFFVNVATKAVRPFVPLVPTPYERDLVNRHFAAAAKRQRSEKTRKSRFKDDNTYTKSDTSLSSFDTYYDPSPSYNSHDHSSHSSYSDCSSHSSHCGGDFSGGGGECGGGGSSGDF